MKVVYLGPVAPHWEVHGVFGDGRMIDEFRQRAVARLQLLPPHDPQFRRNRERSRVTPSASTSSSSGTSATTKTTERQAAGPGSSSGLGCSPVTMKPTRSAMVTA